MAITHSFYNETDYTQGGQWFDDYGRRICYWEYDTASHVLIVTCGTRGKRVDLSSFIDQQLTDNQLISKLPTLAIETAQNLNKSINK